MTSGIGESGDLGGFAAIIDSRLAADARMSKAVAFGWLCGGGAIALCLAALGLAAALIGYSHMLSLRPAAELAAEALADAFRKAEFKTDVTGTMALSKDTELRLAKNQVVHLEEGTTVRLDPHSSVQIVGNLRMPQPSARQLQQDTRNRNDDLPFTSYMVFRSVNLGAGAVETGWYYDLSDTNRPRAQHCYYREALDDGLAGKITIARNGTPEQFSPLVKLPFKIEEALADCIWFSGY
jgi:hypothetical protein